MESKGEFKDSERWAVPRAEVKGFAEMKGTDKSEDKGDSKSERQKPLSSSLSSSSQKPESIRKRKKHWSVDSEDGALVARATNFVYRRIIAPPEEGGLKNFFEENCMLFEDDDNCGQSGELRLETMDLFKQYERNIEVILNEFAEKEKLDSVGLMTRLRSASEHIPQAEKSIQMLLAATEFPKFVRLMKIKVKEIRKKEEAMKFTSIR